MIRKQTHVLKSALFPFISIQIRYFAAFSSLDVSPMNRMITEFAKSGDLVSAQKLFDQMPERDIVSWNSIMAADSWNDRCNEALRIFVGMHNNGLSVNHTSFATVLTCCAKLRALDQGKQIHGLSIKLRSSENVFVGTSLITMYSKCNVFDCLIRVFDGIECVNLAAWNALISGFVLNRRISEAREVFDRMPSRNVVSWTAMISGYIEVKKVRVALELFNSMPLKNPVTVSVMLGGLVSDGQYKEAIELFARMMNDGVQANEAMVVKVIGACSGLKTLRHGRKLHGYVIKLGLHLHQVIEGSLVLMYCECLNIEDAKLEFDKMESKFLGSWNSLICGHINNNKVDEARTLFDNMDEKDKISWNSMINGYLKVKRINDAMELFSKMPEPTIETITALMSSFIGSGRIDEAQKFFNMMPRRDVMACTTLLFGYVVEGQMDKASKLFNEMPERNVVTYNVMISGLLHHGKVREAYKLFNESPEKDSISWDTLIAGCVENELYYEAMEHYKRMVLSDIMPSDLVMASLLRASAKISLLIHGEQIHTIAIKLGHDSCLVVGNSLINMYCKCGDLSKAKSNFDWMERRDVVSWNGMIYGYALNGLGKEAIEMFESMKKAVMKPDDVTFLGILSACNHTGLLEEAQHYFNAMTNDHGIMPRLPHYACMIDLLCRMGMVEKAESLLRSMPFEPDPIIWTSLLSRCRSNGSIKLAEHAANQLFAWDPTDRMPYLHLMGIYAVAGRWDDMENMRSRIRKVGTKKQPGCSWI